MAKTKERSLPDLLSEARGDRSYRQAAEALGITDRMYKQWETGYAKPSSARADEIAEFCGVPRADVLVMLGVITREEGEHLRNLPGNSRTGWSDVASPDLGIRALPVPA